jgi:hypothetical protein
MKQAAALQPYSAAKDFPKPYGVDAYLEAARLQQEVVAAGAAEVRVVAR